VNRRGSSGPLTGVRVIEMAALGPVPFAGMLLSDLGADVIRVDRPGPAPADDPALFLTKRGRRSIVVDAKNEHGRDLILDLVNTADVLLEGNRPGVMEKLGLGPDECLAAKPALVYGRATGWGQEGPYAQRAGHDINYLALSGVLWGIGRPGERPTPPLNLLGDYGGGGMMLAFGVVAAVLEARVSGVGQVVDAAMLDGTALMSMLIWEMRTRGLHEDARGVNLLDTGAPFYDVYECSDGQYVAVGALEPQFYAELCRRVGFEQDLDLDSRAAQQERSTWPGRKKEMQRLFATRTRDEWQRLLENADACVTPVLSWAEAPAHPHNAARQTFAEIGGVLQPAPAPRFSRTPAAVQAPACAAGEDTTDVLTELGLSDAEQAALRSTGALG
jgi:alpha-methylacyl-CoA racemase